MLGDATKSPQCEGEVLLWLVRVSVFEPADELLDGQPSSGASVREGHVVELGVVGERGEEWGHGRVCPLLRAGVAGDIVLGEQRDVGDAEVPRDGHVIAELVESTDCCAVGSGGAGLDAELERLCSISLYTTPLRVGEGWRQVSTADIGGSTTPWGR